MQNRKKKHLFLTGEKQVGKSTLLRCLLEDCADLGGFYTVRRRESNSNMAVYMLRAGQEDSYCDENLLFICGRIAAAERFDTLGCDILTQSRDCSIIVMDELGRKERDARKFQQMVLELLDGDIPVYGVLQRADSAFLRAVAEHPAVQLVEVTRENRTELLNKLKIEW